MLSPTSRATQHTTCLGPVSMFARRDLLASGIGALLGASLAPTLAEVRAANQKSAQRKQKQKSCILLWMNGGPSHIDTFDPKPGTKPGGPFKAIATKARDVRISEHLPRIAEQVDKLAIIRSMTSKEGNHDRGHYLLHTGYAPSATLQHPSLGAWVSHELGDAHAELPNFVSIRGPSIGAGFIGVEHGPFVVQKPSEGVRNLPLAKDIDAGRFSRRLTALEKLQQGFLAETGRQEIRHHDVVYQKAVRLMNSPAAKAFDLSSETAATKKNYGDTDFGRGCLMARRLIEAGVRFVEVTLDGWDTHFNNFSAVKNLSAELDPAMAALLSDLAARDLLNDTLVIWMGEFGRTPQITEADGRDHHPAAWSAALAGCGVRSGFALGTTDPDGAKVASSPITVPNLFATIATLLGLDPKTELMSPVGRPIAISDAGQVVRELIVG